MLISRKNNFGNPSNAKIQAEVPIAKITVKTVKSTLLSPGGLRNRKTEYRTEFSFFKFTHPSKSTAKTNPELNKKIIKNNTKVLFHIFINPPG
ncbi:MAG: hypothetical protein PHC71_05285, partial [Candidatus Omnitrophica bacterium]|nr:hypothetical protein [Candidatus Omnitrophota bacterium]